MNKPGVGPQLASFKMKLVHSCAVREGRGGKVLSERNFTSGRKEGGGRFQMNMVELLWVGCGQLPES